MLNHVEGRQFRSMNGRADDHDKIPMLQLPNGVVLRATELPPADEAERGAAAAHPFPTAARVPAAPAGEDSAAREQSDRDLPYVPLATVPMSETFGDRMLSDGGDESRGTLQLLSKEASLQDALQSNASSPPPPRPEEARLRVPMWKSSTAAAAGQAGGQPDGPASRRVSMFTPADDTSPDESDASEDAAEAPTTDGENDHETSSRADNVPALSNAPLATTIPAAAISETAAGAASSAASEEHEHELTALPPVEWSDQTSRDGSSSAEEVRAVDSSANGTLNEVEGSETVEDAAQVTELGQRLGNFQEIEDTDFDF
ncbi:hypothetical protein STCU_12276 [Strigomonas culicis]|uniref:Uncharacterized protein n=1 Tax=Strigomonas culicis TaxID=28005 RepID=S9TFS9_9TRYP|nr:hypothetical protein STCU_12276 [Strigomonas culicis]|eukprot:EPY15183.1 hypothetical protein STCU_12276 [Strigomonas culicis]